MIHWLFASIPTFQRNAFRTLVCALSIAILILYLPILDLVYSSEGLSTASQIFRGDYQYVWSVFQFIDTPVFVFTVFLISIICLILLANGTMPVVTSIIGFLTFTSFFNRYPNLDYGGSMTMSVALFFQVLQALFDKYAPVDKKDSAHGWTLRAIQIQLALIYLMAGISKLHSPMWQSGEAMARILNSEQAIFTMPWMGSAPITSMILTYGTILAELSFPFIVWIPKLRKTALVTLCLMHVGIFCTLHVTVLFTEAFFVLLLSFLTAQEWKVIVDKLAYFKCFTQRKPI